MKPLAALLAIALAGCASAPPKAEFRADTPYSKVIQGSGDAVCWSVKRAFLMQGYMLDRGGESVILIGTKDTQPDDDTNVTQRMQTTCVDNHDGTSTVFATATRETSRLQRAPQSVSAGVSIATVTLPAGNEKSLRPIRRETIQDPKFYQGFYALVEKFSSQEIAARKANGSTGASRDDGERR
jgi:uncharacterized protein DUF2242